MALRAVELARESTDRRTEADALNALAAVHHSLGRPESAIRTYREALRVARRCQTGPPEVAALIGLAAVHRDGPIRHPPKRSSTRRSTSRGAAATHAGKGGSGAARRNSGGRPLIRPGQCGNANSRVVRCRPVRAAGGVHRRPDAGGRPVGRAAASGTTARPCPWSERSAPRSPRREAGRIQLVVACLPEPARDRRGRRLGLRWTGPEPGRPRSPVRRRHDRRRSLVEPAGSRFADSANPPPPCGS